MKILLVSMALFTAQFVSADYHAMKDINAQAAASMGDKEESDLSLEEELLGVHEALYNLDYRKLELEDFVVYTKTLEKIKELSTSAVCESGEQSEILVIEKNYVFDNAWNGCKALGARPESQKTVFQQDAIRECYKDGFSTCLVKEKARIKNYTSQGNGASAQCNVSYDIVIEAKN